MNYKSSLVIIILLIISFLFGILVRDYISKKRIEKQSALLAYSGMLMLDDANYSKAIESFYAAIYLDSSNGIAHQGLARIYYDKELYDLSRIEFEKFIENPGDKFIFQERSLKKDENLAYCYLADIYEKLSNKEKSKEYYMRVADKDPGHLIFLYLLIEQIVDKEQKNSDDFKKIELYSKCFEQINSFYPNDDLNIKYEKLRNMLQKLGISQTDSQKSFL